MNDDFVLAMPYDLFYMVPLGKKVVMTVYAICDRCSCMSYNARKLGDEFICPACMKKEHIDDRWIYDYQQAFDEIDREFPRVNE